MHSIIVATKGNNDVVNITDEVFGFVVGNKTTEGGCLVFVPHSTCGVTTVEFEPGLVADLGTIFEHLVPSRRPWRHNERWHDGNGHAHLRASLVGPSLVVPVSEGTPQLGTWQQIVLIDFDNKQRDRTVLLLMLS